MIKKAYFLDQHVKIFWDLRCKTYVDNVTLSVIDQTEAGRASIENAVVSLSFPHCLIYTKRLFLPFDFKIRRILFPVDVSAITVSLNPERNQYQSRL